MGSALALQRYTGHCPACTARQTPQQSQPNIPCALIPPTSFPAAGAEGAEGAAGGAAAGGDAAALSSSSISRELGKHPATGLPVLLKFGPFGPYVQVDPPASAVAAAEEAAAAKAKGSKKKAAGPQPKRWVLLWL